MTHDDIINYLIQNGWTAKGRFYTNPKYHNLTIYPGLQRVGDGSMWFFNAHGMINDLCDIGWDEIKTPQAAIDGAISFWQQEATA